MNKKKVILTFIILFVPLAPSYIVAIGIGMPFPNILFPPMGKYYMYDLDNYSCLEQSEEIEKWLEHNGIHVYGKSGYKDGNCSLIINQTTGAVDYNIQGGNGHRWISIKVIGIEIPFDSVTMLPVSPSWFCHFQVIIKDEGRYYKDYEISRNKEIIEKIEIE